MKSLTIVSFLLLGVLTGACEDLEKAPSPLLGNWQAKSISEGGQELSEEALKAMQIEFKGDEFILRQDGKAVLSGTFTIDENKTPKFLTLIMKRGEKELKIPAIYQIKRASLNFCHPIAEGGPRPARFEAGLDRVLAKFSKAE